MPKSSKRKSTKRKSAPRKPKAARTRAPAPPGAETTPQGKSRTPDFLATDHIRAQAGGAPMRTSPRGRSSGRKG